jgi:hypothetical protein
MKLKHGKRKKNLLMISGRALKRKLAYAALSCVTHFPIILHP